MYALNICVIIMGLAFIVFNKQISEGARQWQIMIYGETYEIWMFRLPFYIGGSLFVLIGIAKSF